MAAAGKARRSELFRPSSQAAAARRPAAEAALVEKADPLRIAESLKLIERHENAEAKKEWLANNPFYVTALEEYKRGDLPYFPLLKFYPSASLLETRPIDVEATELFLFILKNKWAAYVATTHPRPLMPKPRALYAMQAELMDFGSMPSAHHTCAGSAVAGADACRFASVPEGAHVYSHILMCEFKARGDIYVCDRTGNVHICTDHRCHGDLLVDRDTRFCSISEKYRSAPALFPGMTGTHYGGDGDGDMVEDVPAMDASVDDAAPFSAPARAPDPPAPPRRVARPLPPPPPVERRRTPPPPLELLDVSHTYRLEEERVAAEQMERLRARHAAPSKRDEGRIREQMESRIIEARLAGTDSTERDLRESYKVAVKAAHREGAATVTADDVADDIFGFAGSSIVAKQTADAEAARKAEKAVQRDILQQTKKAVAKRRTRHGRTAPGDGASDESPAERILAQCVADGRFDVIHREKLVHAVTATLEDVLTGHGAQTVRRDALVRNDLDALKQASAYVQQCHEAGRAPILTTLLAFDCQARAGDAWCRPSDVASIDWTKARDRYQRLMVRYWDRFAPFVYCGITKRNSQEERMTLAAVEPAKFTVGFLYYIASNSYEHTDASGARHLIVPCDEFVHRYVVPQAHLAQLKGQYDYQQRWVHQFNSMISIALACACKEYERLGRLSEITSAATESSFNMGA